MYNHVPSETAYVTLRIELRASCFLGKYSTNAAASHPCNAFIQCHRKEIGSIKVKGEIISKQCEEEKYRSLSRWGPSFIGVEG